MISYFSYCSSKLFWLKEILSHRGLSARWRTAQLIEEGSLECTLKNRDAKLQKLLRHVVDTVPYYQKHFEGRDIANLKISDFPIISKADIRNHEDEFTSTTVPVEEWSRTSGSTGEPFRFGKTAAENVVTYADLWRGLQRFGIRAGDRRVLVKGVDETPHLPVSARIRRRIYGWINRCIVVDAHFLARSDANIERELRRILSYRPQYFHGYVSSVYLLAKYAEDHQIDCSGLSLKAIVTESEKCFDFQREVMERVFRTRVVENYGCVEFGMIAQPAHDGMLCVNEDHVFVEATEEGEAVYTNLDEYAFPLIRFKNGDMIKIGEPHSELPYRTIFSVEGRIAETIHLPQGGNLQGYIVMYPISKHMKFLKAYQVYQPDVNHLIIRLLPSEGRIPYEIKQQILEEMKEITGIHINLAIEVVTEIPLTKRGKRAFVVSEVR